MSTRFTDVHFTAFFRARDATVVAYEEAVAFTFAVGTLPERYVGFITRTTVRHRSNSSSGFLLATFRLFGHVRRLLVGFALCGHGIGI
jgi:hypothetical protein